MTRTAGLRSDDARGTAVLEVSFGTRLPVLSALSGSLRVAVPAGVVHHVAIYAGGGLMVHAPGTGRGIETIRTATPSCAAELVRARRYVG